MKFCLQLCEVKQKINILTFLQNQIQMDLCESESNYNAIEKHVKELEAITPENVENQTLHNSIYTTAVCLNTSLNALQDTLDALNVNVGNDAKVKAVSIASYQTFPIKKLLFIQERTVWHFTLKTASIIRKFGAQNVLYLQRNAKTRRITK